MKIRYLLDTNIISEPLKPKPDAGVMGKLKANRSRLATAAPVWNELLYGCHRLPLSRRRQQIEAYLYHVILPSMDILPYDEKAAAWHAQERARLEAVGKTPPFVDGQIAAITKVNGLVLVTRNIKDYKLFSDIELQSWH